MNHGFSGMFLINFLFFADSFVLLIIGGRSAFIVCFCHGRQRWASAGWNEAVVASRFSCLVGTICNGTWDWDLFEVILMIFDKFFSLIFAVFLFVVEGSAD
jgi:hypothetical protein